MNCPKEPVRGKEPDFPSLVMAASTLLRLLKPRILSLCEHLGGIKQIFPHRDVDVGVCLNEAF